MGWRDREKKRRRRRRLVQQNIIMRLRLTYDAI